MGVFNVQPSSNDIPNGQTVVYPQTAANKTVISKHMPKNNRGNVLLFSSVFKIVLKLRE